MVHGSRYAEALPLIESNADMARMPVERSSMDADSHWKLKKEISLPMMAAFFIHTGTVIWFIATLNAEVQRVKEQTTAFLPQTEKIIKLEANMENIKDGLAEIKGLLRSPVPGAAPGRLRGLN